jgi:RNA polymerase sigma factor (sigma-70 family)
MQPISDSNLLEQLKMEDNASFELLYKFYFTSIANYVGNNYGNNEDAEDVFQETIIVLLQKVREQNFVLTSSLKTYLFAIAKNIWLKRLRDNKIITVSDFEKYQFEAETFSTETKPEKTKDEKVENWLTKITANCYRILKAIFFYKEPMDSVMKKMGWKNKHTAANQQYKCIQQVKKQKDKDEEGIL